MFGNKLIILMLLISIASHFTCLSTVPTEQHDKKLQVEISNGVLQGKHIISEFNNVSFYAFFGIPYAQPPVGDLRFRAPQPALNWTGVLDARTERSQCPQFSEGSEDCLFINVYTLQTEKEKGNKSLLPVMVWIHGGGFVFGSSGFSMYGPDRLITEDVVIATLNYRLGVFGFLCTSDMASPGNYGLKDQIQALKWVQQNIRQFGGNPSQVTIFGESAGAASVHYLLQTPLAEGLFHRAISQSGSTLSKWALYREPRKIAFRIAELANIESATTEELVTRLRSIKFDELDSAGEEILMEDAVHIYDDGIPFSPCIEPEHDNAVITNGSYSLLSSNQFNKVPLLTGFNSQEAGILVSVMDMIKPALAVMDSTPITIAHKSMNISSNETRIKVGLQIKSFYFGNGSIATAPIDDILDFISDDAMLRPIHKTVKLFSQSVPVYFYRFSYEASKPLHGDRNFKGVAHAEDVFYIFYARLTRIKTISTSMSSKIVKMWTNFAKTGNPTPIPDKLLNYVTWPVAKKKINFFSFFNTDPNISDNTYLDINENLTVRINPRAKAMKFWDDLYQKYPSLDGTY